MKNIYIWLDDLRPINYQRVPTEYTAIHIINYTQAIELITHYANDNLIIDFDHDLDCEGELTDSRTGYDLAKWIVEQGIPQDSCYFRIHSMNPIGAKNIRQLLTHYGYREV